MHHRVTAIAYRTTVERGDPRLLPTPEELARRAERRRLEIEEAFFGEMPGKWLPPGDRLSDEDIRLLEAARRRIKEGK